jgi:FkbM family methyltransferase
MLETFHRIGTRVRHSKFLERQQWLWRMVEPLWQGTFRSLTAHRGYVTGVNDDEFRLVYDYAARQDRRSTHEWEGAAFEKIVKEVREGSVVFDVGAHVGMFTLSIAKRVGATGHVFAFEPSPRTAAVLLRHIRLNGYDARATVIQAVLSDATGTVPFFVFGESMAASLSRENVELFNPEHPVGRSEVIQVPSYTLDGFCRERGVLPAFIKIDVEGAEQRVLAGARETMERYRPRILCEIHPQQMKQCGSSETDLLAMLQALRYEVRPIDTPRATGIYHAMLVPQ